MLDIYKKSVLTLSFFGFLIMLISLINLISRNVAYSSMFMILGTIYMFGILIITLLEFSDLELR